MPLPIQSGSMTERVRKFFRIRGKVGFSLDEVVAPVVIVQDLTAGPYQSGVTPAGGAALLVGVGALGTGSVAVILNDKFGSTTPVLGRQFDERSFSLTFAEFQNIALLAGGIGDVRLLVTTRADVIALGIPTTADQIFEIQNGDGRRAIPVELWTFPTNPAGGIVWRGILGDNTNTLGSRRTFDAPFPNVTIDKDTAVVMTVNSGVLQDETVQFSCRGVYQEQPA